ncbi:glycosyltransferase family 4 protein [Mucilaginibacter celer]|uniref:Glycosyltransferase n=1 Tax=Mucilaginibacter celer TaxID=2305508 RepID=A0A494VXN9_9SPHI|nr:glycosyltransferase family 4 protein [Mucilaginibacter celer]AYL96015.1 glycosyltransferase [Mucilaginibacter celer]
MRYVFNSYVQIPEFNRPEAWFERTRAYAGIMEALARTNEVISIEHIDFEGRAKKNGIDYHFKRFATSWSRYLPWKLNNYIKSLKPDMVFVQSLHFPLQVIQLRLMLGPKVKIMVQNHAEKPFTGLKKLAQKLVDRYIDAYLFASRDMGLEWVTEGNISSPRKIFEVMEVSSVFYPINREEALAKTGVTGNPAFLWVGRLNDNKDPLNVTRAFLRFAEKIPGARLYMIYHTEELLDEIQSLLEIHPNKEAIRLIGKRPHTDLLYWFNSADFILSGSHYEGSGTAVCEAMSCGCVPLVTDIQSFRMITNNGECGMLYEAGNEQALFDVLMQTGQMNLKEKRRLSLAYYQNNLSFNAIAGRIEEIAKSLKS